MKWHLLALLFALLAGCGDDDSYSVEGLTRMLDDPDPVVRATGAFGLQSYGFEAAPAADKLADLMDDDDTDVRISAAYALAAIGPSAEETVPALAGAADDPEPAVRAAVCYAIPLVAPHAPEAAPVLQELVRDAHSDVRREASRGLRKLRLAAKYSTAATEPDPSGSDAE